MSIVEFEQIVKKERLPLVLPQSATVPIQVIYDSGLIGRSYTDSMYASIDARTIRVQELARREIRVLVERGMASESFFDYLDNNVVEPFVNRSREGLGRTYSSCQVLLHVISELMGWPAYPLGRAFYQVSQAHYFPIIWKGRFPDGYCLAYRPPDHPWPELPPQCVPTPEQLKAGRYKPKHPAPLVLPVPDIGVESTAAWAELAAASAPSEALVRWLQAWCETPACREVLQALCARVDGIAVRGRRLCIHARNAFDRGVTIRCAQPWDKELAPMPRSAALVIRRHNGIDIIEDGRDDPADVVFAWKGGRFAMPTWRETWTPDPQDPDEPFMRPPLVPLYYDDHNVWAFHPHRRRGADDLELRRVIGPGQLGRPLPFGLGAAVLRLLAHLLVPAGQELGRQFGLGFLSNGEVPDDRFGLGQDAT